MLSKNYDSSVNKSCANKGEDMQTNYFEKLMPILNTIPQEKREQFYEYFQNVPIWLIDSFVFEKVKKDTIFIREGAPVDTIYFILDGVIKATDYRIYGIAFDFMVFTKLYAFGGMEVIMDIERYRTSMQTVTDCLILKIPSSQFNQWMKSDIRALRHESKLMGEYMLEQARNVRAFLFLQGADRLALLFVNRYDKYAKNDVLKMHGERKELSDYTGLSIRTVIRSVKTLVEEGLITVDGSQIIITKKQYQLLKEGLDEVLSDDM